MISTSLLRPSIPTTLGELRRLTADLPDETPLCLEGMDSDFLPPAVYLDTMDQPQLIFMEQ